MRRSQLAYLRSCFFTSICSTPSNHFRLPLLLYILSLKSCRLPSVFIRRPPRIIARGITDQLGSFAPWELPQFIATANPSATLSPSFLFPVQPVIGRTCSRVFLSGTRKVSPVAEHALVTVLSLPPRRSVRSPRSARDMPCGLRSEAGGSASGSKFVWRPPVGSLSLRHGDSLSSLRRALSAASSYLYFRAF